MATKRKRKRKLKKSVIFKSFALLFFLVCLVTVYYCLRLGFLPLKYLLVFLVVLVLLNLITYRLLVSKVWHHRLSGILLSVLGSTILFIGIFYGSTTLRFLENSFQSRDRVENYDVIVLDSSNYGNLREFKNGKIGVPKPGFSEGAKLIQNEIKKRTTLSFEEKDSMQLIQSLLKKDLRVIVLEQTQKELYMEVNEDFQNHAKVIETISVTVENTKIKGTSELMKQPFQVLVLGTDEYGAINQTSRSDVNMLITVNPLSHQVLLTSIPRDYYVSLKGMEDAKDKLTHASIYGIDCSMNTIADLLSSNISYYVKINFTSLIGLVEAVGGVDVESEVSFEAHYYDEPADEWVRYSFLEGMNHLNGRQALAFARERKSFALGDRTRLMHQQRVLSALIQKITSPAILTNYTRLIRALEGSFETNIAYSDIMLMFQMQLDKNPTWSVESMVLEGKDDTKPVYSLSNQYSYVMVPDEQSVEQAKEKIAQVLKGN